MFLSVLNCRSHSLCYRVVLCVSIQEGCRSEREQNGSRFVESNLEPTLYTSKFYKHPRNSFYCAPPCMSLVSRSLPPIE